MEMFNEICGAPIFDVYYDDEEPIFDVYGDADSISYIYGGGESINSSDNLAVQGFEYFAKNIQVTGSRITIGNRSFGCAMDDSSFSPSRRNNESFKEFIDVSHVEAFITQLWIRSVVSTSALTRPIQGHEPVTPTPKKLGQDEPVPDKPPPYKKRCICGRASR
ncbi:unnamed protein product [Microthlaspi erraticum]|uniref:Uncharacterized protein n=1 Tax=Microthlaspi erraticum TaxID=1685480 RepID=A0A6D2LQV7_9BRAS|nr:unnamed protein product [Microthlaspi erraticum]